MELVPSVGLSHSCERYIELVKKEGVRNVHALGLGLGRIGAGLGRIGEVSGGVAGLQGLESGSSPTSGTVFPQVRGFLAV
jgi:hypothetical protein